MGLRSEAVKYLCQIHVKPTSNSKLLVSLCFDKKYTATKIPTAHVTIASPTKTLVLRTAFSSFLTMLFSSLWLLFTVLLVKWSLLLSVPLDTLLGALGDSTSWNDAPERDDESSVKVSMVDDERLLA